MFTWIVTGAAGHLGGTIVRLLQERKAEVRGLVLPHESAADQGETRYFTGDVTLPKRSFPFSRARTRRAPWSSTPPG